MQEVRPNHLIELAVAGHNLTRNDGQGRWMLEIVRALATEGYEVTVYSFTLDPDVRDLPQVIWRRLRKPPGPQLLIDVWLFIAASFALRRGRHQVQGVLGPCALPSARPIYFAAFCHAAWRDVWRAERVPPDLYRRGHAWLSRLLERLVVRRCSDIVAMSEATAREVAGLNPSASWRVVPGGIDIEEFKPAGAATRGSARTALGVEGSFVIGFVGEFVTGRKGLQRLAAAVDGSPDEVIAVRGPGSPDDTISFLTSMGISGRNLVFLGAGPTSEVYAASDAVAVPSLYEPFSIVALEAAACGLPVIVSNRAGAAPYLIRGEGALEVDPAQPNTIRAAIDALRADPGKAREMGARARTAAEGLSWDRVGEIARSTIESVIGSPRMEGA